MKFESIVDLLKKKYPEAPDAELRALATDVNYAVASSYDDPAELVADDNLMQKLRDRFATREELAAEARKKVQAEDPKSCPICKMPLKPVLLDNNRKAVFCAKHFVVFPHKE